MSLEDKFKKGCEEVGGVVREHGEDIVACDTSSGSLVLGGDFMWLDTPGTSGTVMKDPNSVKTNVDKGLIQIRKKDGTKFNLWTD